MTVSVIIPTFNRRETILRAVESALGQTRPPLEVIVVDDGSTDGTREVVEGRPGVRYVWQANQRQAAARNTGLSLARGEVIATLDSDDWWDADHLERALRQMQRHQVPVYCANWREIGRQGEEVTTDAMRQMKGMIPYLDRVDEEGMLVLEQHAARKLALIQQPAPSSSMVIKRNLIQGWDSEMARFIREDLLILIDAVFAGGRGLLLSGRPTWTKPVEGESLTNQMPAHQNTESWLRGEVHVYRRMRPQLSPIEAAELRRLIAQLAFDHAYAVSLQRPLWSIPLYLKAFAWAPAPRPILTAFKQIPRLFLRTQV